MVFSFSSNVEAFVMSGLREAFCHFDPDAFQSGEKSKTRRDERQLLMKSFRDVKLRTKLLIPVVATQSLISKFKLTGEAAAQATAQKRPAASAAKKPLPKANVAVRENGALVHHG